MTDPFATRAIWAFNWKYQAEHTAAAIIATCQQFGITVLQQEVAYGQVFQGQIDGLSPANLQAVGTLRDTLSGAGMQLVPVVVPRNLSDVPLHGTIAQMCGSIVVDMECDSSGDYWPSAQMAAIPTYARALRAAAGDEVLIGWQPDSRIADDNRAVEWRYLAAEVQPFVNAWLPQLYAGWLAYGLGITAVGQDERRFQKFAGTGLPVAPTLYTAESLFEPGALWERVKDQAIGLCAFRLGATNAEGLAMVRDLAIRDATPEPPSPPPVDPRDVALSEVAQWLTDDGIGAELRRQRLHDLLGVK